MGCDQCCAILVAFFLPPVAICCYKGCNSQAWLCLLLTIFLPYVGGLIYAIIVICEGKQQPIIAIPSQVVVVTSQAQPHHHGGDHHHHHHAQQAQYYPPPQGAYQPPMPGGYAPPPPYNAEPKY